MAARDIIAGIDVVIHDGGVYWIDQLAVIRLPIRWIPEAGPMEIGEHRRGVKRAKVGRNRSASLAVQSRRGIYIQVRDLTIGKAGGRVSEFMQGRYGTRGDVQGDSSGDRKVVP